MNTANKMISALKRQIVIGGHADAAQFGVGLSFFQALVLVLMCFSSETHSRYAQDDQEVPVGS